MPFNPARLRELRETAGESRAATAVACDIGYTTVVSLELAQRRPSGAVLERLADHFGVSIDALFDRAAS